MDSLNCQSILQWVLGHVTEKPPDPSNLGAGPALQKVGGGGQTPVWGAM